MKLKHVVTFLLFVAAAVAYEYAFPPQPYSGNCDFPLPARPPSAFRLAFGSCNDQDKDQPLWDVILSAHPDLWMWLGDNIYADTDDMNELRSMYDLQKNHPGYARLRRTIPIIGIYDDHDYGENSADASWPYKYESRKQFFEFIDEPDSSSRRTHEGVYTTYVYTVGENSFRIVLLDTRFFRDGDEMLGEAQWQWLDSVMSKNQSPLTLIATSTQVLRVDFWKDKWSERGKQQLYSILSRRKVPGVILLSGDRHHGELSMVWPPEMTYPVFELTSSGMTHYKNHLWYWSGQEKNRHRLGAPYGNLNFGIVDIDFSNRAVDLYIVDRHGHARIRQHIPLNLISPS